MSVTSANWLGRAVDYGYSSTGARYDDHYISGPVLSLCHTLGARRVLEIGCGNGNLSRRLQAAGLEVVGLDPSHSGIEIARVSVPGVPFFRMSVEEDPALLGELDFDLAVSTEVIEHLYTPRSLMRFAAVALRPGGYLVISTPYHGYAKNLLLSLIDGWDAHLNPLWDGGHIKFWSPRTLRELAQSEGFTCTEVFGVGRCVGLWKSMIGVFRRPLD